MKAAQSTGCVFDERKVAKPTRAPNKEKGVDVRLGDGGEAPVRFLINKSPMEPVGQQMTVDGLRVEIVPNMFGSCLQRNEPFGETSVKGYFVAGDAGAPMIEVTFAIAHGVAVAGGVSAQQCAEEGEWSWRESKKSKLTKWTLLKGILLDVR